MSTEPKMCKCGHSKFFHRKNGNGRCVAWAWEKDENDPRGACECRQFELAEISRHIIETYQRRTHV
jgi:hypothetical protein